MTGLFEMLIIAGIVLLVVSLSRRRHENASGDLDDDGLREPRRPRPPPLPPGRMRPRATVSVGQLVFALLFFPFVLFFWVLASLGDLVSLPVHLAVGAVTGGVALLFSLIGATPERLWRVSGRQFLRAGRGALDSFVRLLSAFGLGGLIERLKEDARDADPAPRPVPYSTSPAAGPRTYPFEDRYRIESSLGSGGSTARLFVVRRVDRHRPVGDRLVLKYFDMGLGSRLEEVIRESRGMQVAKEMGIVLDHHLAEDHFYYVMPYYEGETLTRAAARVHRSLAPKEEMPPEDVRTCLGWIAELLRILDGYHHHGVIHKDVKPDNVIVTDAGIRLVDLGLLTPLTSAMTLTTHGTEYFRDPEMVKLAVQGKRVRDVTAVRFDIYSAGAVLYYLLEGSFPACGPLSRFSRPVPMVLSVIVSRAMAEGEKRYADVAAMRRDVQAVLDASEAGSLGGYTVNRLPSMAGTTPSAPSAPPPPPPLVPVLPVGSAPSRRRHRGPWGLLVLLPLLVGGLYLTRGGGSPSSVPVAISSGPVAGATVLTGANVAQAIEGWRHTLEVLHDATGSNTSLSAVPVLFVVADSARLDRIVGDAKVELAVRQIPFHPSATLAAKIGTILDRGGPDDQVTREIAAAAAPDEAPMVARISDAGYRSGSRIVELRFRYDGFQRSREMVLPGGGDR